ncbi:YbhB/YbcL family Raf kinase inhibitor-like protein [Hymenobacter sp. CRA2]|uniref:YbhB/YbcL family Raf kinase inhibitor-like protein n=1 Tax=Hymenobacter sp. CRA2 TaxID=1955620 RepID=UPI00098F6450|nr:YbhB/YbcL family Raf kinase inhibitor-like protein [Hymenobacter sp. CRA2]OON71117.1 kinase inhibitor [Hymenobacter sp. CRA2]
MKRILTLLAATALSSAALAQSFTLKSADLGGQLPARQYFNGMGFGGENLSPQLAWEHAPAGTKSFAVTMYDLDAPTGSGFWHWVVFDIPAEVTELKAGAGDPARKLLPTAAVQAHNDAGLPGYFGAAPTAGPAHRYMLTVYALDKMLSLPPTATPAYIGFNMSGATLAKASLLVYGQKK